MSFKLTSAESKTREDLTTRLTTATNNLKADSAVPENLPARITEYNEVAVAVEEFRAEIADRLRSEYDDKSEKWQEGDAGQDADALICEWEEFSIDEIDEDDDLTLDGAFDEVESVLDAFTSLNDQPAS